MCILANLAIFVACAVFLSAGATASECDDLGFILVKRTGPECSTNGNGVIRNQNSAELYGFVEKSFRQQNDGWPDHYSSHQPQRSECSAVQNVGYTLNGLDSHFQHPSRSNFRNSEYQEHIPTRGNLDFSDLNGRFSSQNFGCSNFLTGDSKGESHCSHYPNNIPPFERGGSDGNPPFQNSDQCKNIESNLHNSASNMNNAASSFGFSRSTPSNVPRCSNQVSSTQNVPLNSNSRQNILNGGTSFPFSGDLANQCIGSGFQTTATNVQDGSAVYRNAGSAFGLNGGFSRQTSSPPNSPLSLQNIDFDSRNAGFRLENFGSFSSNGNLNTPSPGSCVRNDPTSVTLANSGSARNNGFINQAVGPGSQNSVAAVPNCELSTNDGFSFEIPRSTSQNNNPTFSGCGSTILNRGSTFQTSGVTNFPTQLAGTPSPFADPGSVRNNGLIYQAVGPGFQNLGATVPQFIIDGLPFEIPRSTPQNNNPTFPGSGFTIQNRGSSFRTSGVTNFPTQIASTPSPFANSGSVRINGVIYQAVGPGFQNLGATGPQFLNDGFTFEIPRSASQNNNPTIPGSGSTVQNRGFSFQTAGVPYFPAQIAGVPSPFTNFGSVSNSGLINQAVGPGFQNFGAAVPNLALSNDGFAFEIPRSTAQNNNPTFPGSGSTIRNRGSSFQSSGITNFPTQISGVPFINLGPSAQNSPPNARATFQIVDPAFRNGMSTLGNAGSTSASGRPALQDSILNLGSSNLSTGLNRLRMSGNQQPFSRGSGNRCYPWRNRSSC